MRILRPSSCDDGAHRHSEREIHQLLSGLAETLATVYWLRRELLRRGQEALVVRSKFVFFYRLSLRTLRTKDVRFEAIMAIISTITSTFCRKVVTIWKSLLPPSYRQRGNCHGTFDMLILNTDFNWLVFISQKALCYCFHFAVYFQKFLSTLLWIIHKYARTPSWQMSAF
jgi:hypothetical protein